MFFLMIDDQKVALPGTILDEHRCPKNYQPTLVSRILSLQLFCLQQTENGIARTTYKKPEKVPWLLSLSECF